MPSAGIHYADIVRVYKDQRAAINWLVRAMSEDPSRRLFCM